MGKGTIVIAYSGGLDTSICIPLMKERYDYDHAENHEHQERHGNFFQDLSFAASGFLIHMTNGYPSHADKPDSSSPEQLIVRRELAGDLIPDPPDMGRSTGWTIPNPEKRLISQAGLFDGYP